MNDKNVTWTVFGDRLKSELERQWLTLTQISQKTGMPLPTLSRYAKSQRIPLATQILRIANTLGVTCDYMLGLSDDPHKTRFGTELHREPEPIILRIGHELSKEEFEKLKKYCAEQPIMIADLDAGICALCDLPSVDAVEVVRCKDCKNSKHWYRDRRRCFLWNEDGVSVFDNGFCNYGERKERDGNGGI